MLCFGSAGEVLQLVPDGPLAFGCILLLLSSLLLLLLLLLLIGLMPDPTNYAVPGKGVV